MKKKRIVPLVLHRHGQVVQTRNFSNFRPLGLLDGTLERLEDWSADEVVLIDISEERNYKGRLDLSTKFESDFMGSLRNHSSRARMPITVGGGIDSFEKAEAFLRNGADKVLINTALQTSPEVFIEIADKFGSQSIVAGIDTYWDGEKHAVYHSRGQVRSKDSLEGLLARYDGLAVGEIFLNSIDRDGKKSGFDMNLLVSVGALRIPVTICGGAGTPGHFVEALGHPNVDGVAAANFFQHVESSIPIVRSLALNSGLPVRRVS